MQKWMYRVLIALIITDVLCMVLYKTGVSIVHDPVSARIHVRKSGLAQIALTVLTFTVVPHFILLLVHFLKTKMWLFLVALLLQFALQDWISYEQNAIWESYPYDYSFVELLRKLDFWAAIAVALAGIYYDRGQLSWLAIYGLVLALYTSTAYLSGSDISPKLGLVLLVFSVLPDVILGFYFWSVLKKKT